MCLVLKEMFRKNIVPRSSVRDKMRSGHEINPQSRKCSPMGCKGVLYSIINLYPCIRALCASTGHRCLIQCFYPFLFFSVCFFLVERCLKMSGFR